MAHFYQHVITARIHACQKAFPGARVTARDVQVGHGPFASATATVEGNDYDCDFANARGGIIVTDVVLSKYNQ